MKFPGFLYDFESVPGYRRRNVERHMIYFRITNYGIAIIHILHERMDAPHHL